VNCVDSLTARGFSRFCVADRRLAPRFSRDVPPNRHLAGELQSKRQA